MSVTTGASPDQSGNNKPSEEFAAYCKTEFERRENSGDDFDAALYRKAMNLVLERLVRMEEGARS